MSAITYQSIRKEWGDDYSLALVYYGMISVLNQLRLTERELQFVAFVAVKNGASFAYNKEEFCKQFDTTLSTVNNIIYRMKKVGVFVKEGGKIRLHPALAVDFKKDLLIKLVLGHGRNV